MLFMARLRPEMMGKDPSYFLVGGSIAELLEKAQEDERVRPPGEAVDIFGVSGVVSFQGLENIRLALEFPAMRFGTDPLTNTTSIGKAVRQKNGTLLINLTDQGKRFLQFHGSVPSIPCDDDYPRSLLILY